MSHKLYEEDMPFDQIDPMWATQLCTYGWLLGIPQGTPFPARIDMLCWDAKNTNVRTAKYRGIITEQFQEVVAQRYATIWNEIISGSFVLRLDSQYDIDFVWSAAKDERWF